MGANNACALENCHPPGRFHAFLLLLALSNFQARFCSLLEENEGVLVVIYKFSYSNHCGPGCQHFEGDAIYGLSQEISWSEFHWLIDLFPVIRVFLSKTQPSQMSDFIQVYTKNSVSFFLVLRVKRARHEMTTRMTGEALFFFLGCRPHLARLIASTLARACTPFTNPKKKRDCSPSIFIRALFFELL